MFPVPGSLLNNTQSFLYGTHPLTGDRSVTIYAFVSSCDPEYSHFFVTYWFFFPYNEGKEICSLRLGKSKAVPMLNIFKKCLGKVVRFGNHVGDWEHMTLQVKVCYKQFSSQNKCLKTGGNEIRGQLVIATSSFPLNKINLQAVAIHFWPDQEVHNAYPSQNSGHY